jgi:Domain of unknown function (DUF4326)
MPNPDSTGRSAAPNPTPGRVVHCRRAPQGSFVYIGRPSTFGNPFRLLDPHDDQERAAVLDRYRQWFLTRIATDPEFRAQVETLRGRDLGCWCAPRPCHGEVILDWLATHPPQHTGRTA